MPYGRGLSMLFEGPPGTGKTMAASIVGNELGLPVFKIDLSKMQSKYIGETEKNLGAVFDIAQKNNAILFFDETDAIFSKRSEVRESHDKYANAEISFLLQRMEEYDGILILTTNFKQNIDAAFMRRISYVIRFPFPEKAQRLQLWNTIFPKEAELEEGIDFQFLAETFELSGAMIKNAAVSAAFLAAAQSRKIGMREILLAVKKQFAKFGKTLSPQHFGPYAVLLEETR
jgi:SpoVK/Ycf46/Vps4 family AAA+-type ATPase